MKRKTIRLLSWLGAALVCLIVSARTERQSRRNVLQSQTGEVLLSSPTARTLAGDKTKLQSAAFRGRLVYSFTSRENSVSYLSVRNVEQGNALSTSPSTYTLRPSPLAMRTEAQYSIAFDPQLSPDGRYVLFKFGSPWEETDTFHLYVLDTQTQNLKLVTARRLSYPFVFWSPDGSYIAYVKGGNTEGDPTSVALGNTLYLGPLKLLVCNWRTGVEQVVAANDTLKNSFAWAPPHALLYSIVAQKPHGSSAQKKDVVSIRPSVFEYSVEHKTSTLIFENGYRPLVSPDGRHIAFYGSEPTTRTHPLAPDWQNTPNDMALMVAKRDGSERKALDRPKLAYPPLLWEADNKHLLTIQQQQTKAQLKGQIKEWDIATQAFRNVASVRANDYQPMPERALAFDLAKPTADGSGVLVLVNEIVGLDYPIYSVAHRLEHVDLLTGKVAMIARLQDVMGFDWHDESSAALAASTPITNTAPTH